MNHPSAGYTPEQAEKFAALRSRYLLAMSWELTTNQHEIETWIAMLDQVFMDIREAGFKIVEVTHP